MNSLLDITPEVIIPVIFMVIGVVMFLCVIVGLFKIIHNPAARSGKTSWEAKADKIAGDKSADELYELAMAHKNSTVADASSLVGEQLLLKAAEKGNAKAQLAVGIENQHDKNDVAIEWLKKAAAQGVDEAFERLGAIYYFGEDMGEPVIEKDPDEALKWYLPLAEKGNTEIQDTVGLLYSLYLDDEENSLKWYKRAAEAGNKDSIRSLVNCYNLRDDTENAVFWCKKLADSGDAEAQYDLAQLYEYDDNPDMEQAVYWFKKSAENGYGNAKVKLATLHLKGYGVEKDEKKSLKMLEEEAASGNGWAQYHLGQCYLNGEGVLKDVSKAFDYFTAAKEIPSAAYQLALLYLDGNGVERDDKKAFELLSGIDIVDDDVMYKTGECYFTGKGTKKDKDKARNLWREASKLGNDAAKEALDTFFGETVEEN